MPCMSVTRKTGINPRSRGIEFWWDKKIRAVTKITSAYFVSDGGLNYVLDGSSTKPYPCTHCDRSYENRSSLNRHMRYECGRHKLYVCPICQKTLMQKSSLHKHMQGSHGIWIHRGTKRRKRNYNSVPSFGTFSFCKVLNVPCTYIHQYIHSWIEKYSIIIHF